MTADIGIPANFEPHARTIMAWAVRREGRRSRAGRGRSPEIESARVLLGRALHSVADFYAHTNWVDIGNTGPNADFGRRPIPRPVASAGEQTCDASGATLVAAGLTKLTSGYYDGVFGCNLPAGKCRHGGAPSCKLDIAKDPAASSRHAAAQKAATDAVRTFVNDLLIEAGGAGCNAVARNEIRGQRVSEQRNGLRTPGCRIRAHVQPQY
jgi:hypothetical protein